MNVLVTGGAGYIGSVVTAELIKRGHHVIVYDNLSKGFRGAVPRKTELIVGDIGDKTNLTRVITTCGIGSVLHFAAFIEAGESMNVPEKYFRNNSMNTLSLLEVLVETGVKNFVFSSTAALYGEPENIPIRETDPLRPTNAYGESKLLVERMLEWFHRIHGLRYASLRYFNAAGATEELGEAHNPESHLIPIILQVALGKRDSISVFGSDYKTKDGTCVRDYIHVLDLAQAHLLALEALAEKPQQIYNLGNGRGFTVHEVIETARRVTGHKIPAVAAPRRPGDPAVLVASSEKIQQTLGWKPQRGDLETIVASAWEWTRKHPKGYS